MEPFRVLLLCLPYMVIYDFTGYFKPQGGILIRGERKEEAAGEM